MYGERQKNEHSKHFPISGNRETQRKITFNVDKVILLFATSINK